jgi:hypothetical protein
MSFIYAMSGPALWFKGAFIDKRMKSATPDNKQKVIVK